MLKKTITFTDYNDQQLTEDFYFNLSTAEITEMELSQKGGLTEYMKKIIAEEDGKKLVELFKELITKSVGKRSGDGRRFIKNQEIIDDFVQTEAYSQLFIELSTDADQAAAFITGVVPSNMKEAVEKAAAQQNGTAELPAESDKSDEPAWLREGRTPTPDEVKNATPEQLRQAWMRKEQTDTKSA